MAQIASREQAHASILRLMDTSPATRSCLLIDASRAIRGENVLELATAVERLRNQIEQEGHEVLAFSYASMPSHAHGGERKHLRDEIELADLPTPMSAMDIRSALEEARNHVQAGDHIVVCSTDPLEATSELRRYIEKMREDIGCEISGVMWSEQLSPNLLGGAANRLFGYERGVAASSPDQACQQIAELLGFEKIAQSLAPAPQLMSISSNVLPDPAQDQRSSDQSLPYDLALSAIAALEALAQIEAPGSDAHDAALEAVERMRATLPRPDMQAHLPSELQVKVDAFEDAAHRLGDTGF